MQARARALSFRLLYISKKQEWRLFAFSWYESRRSRVLSYFLIWSHSLFRYHIWSCGVLPLAFPYMVMFGLHSILTANGVISTES